MFSFFVFLLLAPFPGEIHGAANHSNYNNTQGMTRQGKSRCPSEIELKSHLFSAHPNYSPSVRPVLNANKSVPVTVGFSIRKLNDILEKEQLMTVTGFLTIEWRNEYLVWQNNSKYDCINDVVFSIADAWLPDISLTNTGNIYDFLLSVGHKILVRKDGRNLYTPAKTFQVTCELDLTFFPFDKQKCQLTFESWLYTTEYQTFKISDTPIDFTRFTENDQWTIVNTSAKVNRISYEIETELFDRIEFTLFLKRKVAYYTINVIGPSVIIALVELVIFMLPAVEIEKVPISFACLLAYTVFQLMINDDMPRTSEHTPMLSYYIILQMIYLSIAILGQGVAFLCVWNLEQLKPAPPKLYQFVVLIGHLVLLEEDTDEDLGNNEQLQYLDERYHGVNPVLEDITGDSSKDIAMIRRFSRRLSAIVDEEDWISRRQRNKERRSTIFSMPRISEGVSDEEETVASSKVSAALPSPQRPSTAQDDVADNDQAELTRELKQRLDSARSHSIIRAHWLFIVSVIDRCLLVNYVIGIVVTPVVIFGILPNA